MDLGKKQLREYRMSYLDVRLDPAAGSLVLYRLGNDNTDMAREQSWDTTSEKVVTGAITASSTRGEATLSVDPFYCRKGDPAAALMYLIDEQELELDDVKREYYEAVVDEEGNTIMAFKQTVDVKPTSFGGPADDGDSIPFELTFSGKKTIMDFDLATEVFTVKTA